MIKIQLDLSGVKNEITRIYQEAFETTRMTSDNQRRDAVASLVEKLRTLKTQLDNGQINLEVR